MTREELRGIHIGVVIDVDDPEKLGRVRVRIPHYAEQGTAWALPLGWPGAGGKARGTFAPVPKGAEVAVFFHLADIDHPYYMAGNFGRGEQPPEAAESSAADAVKVFAIETDRWRVILDSREGKELCQIRDKKTEDVIEIDGVNMGVKITGTSMVLIESSGAIKLDAPLIVLGDRVVTPNGKPIN